uniref:LSM1 homolog, mRNA degradation associated n=1 Tax=Oncorhynchus kisutch TaxID=8019 RepID=A0A8C7H9A4_ONCKI
SVWYVSIPTIALQYHSIAYNIVRKQPSIFVCVFVCVANLVLQQTVERIHVGKRYGDIPRGIFIVRGENVVLLGEIDLEKESDTSLQQVCIEDILEEQRLQQQSRQEAEKTKHLALKERGLVMPRSDIMDEYGVQHQY